MPHLITLMPFAYTASFTFPQGKLPHLDKYTPNNGENACPSRDAANHNLGYANHDDVRASHDTWAGRNNRGDTADSYKPGENNNLPAHKGYTLRNLAAVQQALSPTIMSIFFSCKHLIQNKKPGQNSGINNLP